MEYKYAVMYIGLDAAIYTCLLKYWSNQWMSHGIIELMITRCDRNYEYELRQAI